MTVERIFAHFKSQNAPSTAAYDPGDPQSYENYIQAMMDDAVDYENAILAVDRSQAQLFFYGYEPRLGPYNPGEPYIGEDPTATIGEILHEGEDSPNRSTFVSTDVRDAIMLMLPGLVRLFGASESPVFLVPRTEQESDAAEQATDYVNYTFWHDNPGFLILYGALKDALTVKTGFVKWWTDNDRAMKRKRFENITADQIQLLLSEDPTARVAAQGKPILPPPASSAPSASAPAPPPAAPALAPLPGPAGPSPPPAGPPAGPLAPPGPPAIGLAASPSPPSPVYSFVIIEYEESKPLIKVAGVPPEEMRLDRYARTFADSRLVGHERIVPVDQLIAMGYPRELCLDHIQTSESTFTTEPQLRNPGRFMGTRLGDGVKYGEWYIKVDKDGDGFPELRHVCTMGQDHKVVSDEEANRVKFALFSCDPIGHTIVGDSMADYVEDIQRIKTNLMRSILDSAAESINPKTVVNQLMVEIDDAMNDDLGAIIRTRGDPSASVMFTSTPFLGQQAMPVVDMLNDVLARRTGLTDAAKGLDPKALQSSTMIGVEAVINGAQERVELVARVLCETGFKDLFIGLYNEICENPNQRRTLKIRGNYVPYDTSTFDASMSVEVNPNLGKGSDMTRALALFQVKQDQQMVIQQYGLNNPVCGIPEMLNTMTDLLSLANVKNIGRYFKTPTPQQMQQILSAPRTPDPMAVAAQAQLEKVRSETARAVGQQHLDRQKMEAENAFKHQQLHARTAVDLEKLSIEARKVGVDHASKMGALASQLMKDQSDSDAADQESQQKMAESQQSMDLENQKAQNDQNIAQVKAISQHQQGMAKVASSHMQGMAKAASQHVLGALAAENQGDQP